MPAPTWAPSVEEVAAIMHARTKATGSGAFLGTFTSSTRPTALQVASMIEAAAVEVGASRTLSLTSQPVAAAAIRYLVAMNVEASFFPNQVGDDPDLVEFYERGFLRLLASLDVLLAAELDASQVVEGAANPNAPIGGFPGLVGTTLTEVF